MTEANQMSSLESDVLYSSEKFSASLQKRFPWKPVKLDTSDLMMKLHESMP